MSPRCRPAGVRGHPGRVEGSVCIVGGGPAGMILGLLLAQYTLTGFDASAHMTEETRGASRAGPRGIVMSIVVSVIAGWILLIGLTFAIQSYDSATGTATGVPPAQIFIDAVGDTGGKLLLLIAMELLTGKMEEPQPSGNGKVNVALVPLGTPLLAGPGAIVATMVFVQQSDKTVADWVAIALGVVAVHVSLYLAMRFANVIHRVLGDSGTILVTRIAGLLLAAIAVQLVADAVEAFIKAA